MRAFEAAVPGRSGGAADVLDLAGELLAGEGDDADGDLLADGEVAAVEFADVGADFPTLEVGDLGDGHAGAGGVAELEGRQLHAPIHHVLVGVLLDVDVAAGLGLEGHVLDVLAGDVGHDFGFVFLRLLDGDAGGGGGFLVGKSWVAWRRRLRAASRRISFWRAVMAAIRGLRRHLEFGEFDFVLGVDAWRTADSSSSGEGVGFGLDDLLLGFGEIGFGLLELELLFGGIELDDDIAGCDQFAGFAEVGDGHVGAADHGGGQHFGVAALEFAAGGDGEGDAALFDLWWWGVRGRRWWWWRGRRGWRPRRGRRRRRGQSRRIRRVRSFISWPPSFRDRPG